MVRRRLDQSRVYRQKKLDGGMLEKMDPRKIPTNFFSLARNMRFGTGIPVSRGGNARVEALTRPAGSMTFPGTAADYVEIPCNPACAIWSGLGPEFTIEWVERPVSVTPTATDDGWIFCVGEDDAAGFVSFGVLAKSGDHQARYLRIYEAGEAAYDEIDMGDVDGAVSPDDLRYYFRVRRKGRLLDTLIVGAAAGIQFQSNSTQFASATSSLKVTSPVSGMAGLFIGGKGFTGSLKGLNSKLCEFRIWNRYLEYGSKYRWTMHPMCEDRDLLVCLRFDEGSGAWVYDSGIWHNHGVVAGSPTWNAAGDVEGLMVGQCVEEYSKGNKLHRLVVAGGSLFREVVR